MPNWLKITCVVILTAGAVPVLVTCLVVLYGAPESHGPTPRPREGSYQPHHPAADKGDARPQDRLGTEGAPLVVEVRHPPKGDPETVAAQEREDQQTATERWNKWLTVALVAATLMQFGALLYQGYWLRQSVRIAERALTELERPFISIEVTEPGIEISGNPLTGPRVWSLGELTFTLFNLGRTPAILTRLEAEIVPWPTDEIVAFVDPSVVGGRELPQGVYSTSERPFQETRNLNQTALSGNAQAAAQGRLAVWFTGFVRFNDILGNRYIAGFAMQYFAVGDRFVTIGGAQHNYAHGEKPGEIPPPSI